MFKRIAVVLGMLTMLSGLFVATSTSASASDGKAFPTCGKGGFCVWEGPDGSKTWRNRWTGDANWKPGLRNDDHAWRNNGYFQPGADHVRIYDAATSPDLLTLCIHLGHYAKYSNNSTKPVRNAALKGNYHRWGGECRAGEPQL